MPSMLNSKVKGYASAVFATLFMASLGIFVKNIESDPTVITFFRLLLSALFMMTLSLLSGRISELTVLPSKSVILSGMFLTSSIVFYIIAIQKTSMSIAVFLLYLGPVFASLAAFLFLKESLTGIDLLSLFMSILGILFMLKFNFHFIGLDAVGVLCGIISGFSYGMNIFSNRIIKPNVSLNSRSFYQFLIGSILIFPFALRDCNISIVLNDIFWLISMAFICGFLGITLMFNAIKRLPAVEYGVLSYLEMFFATLFGVLLFRENMDIFKIMGGFLILLSGLLQVFKNNIKRMFL